MASLTPHCEQVLVVGGAHIEPLRRTLPMARVMYAPDWRKGMRWSLRSGLRACPPGPVLMTHVDRPGILDSTLEALIDSHHVLPTVPRYRGRNGHPIIIPQYLRERLMEWDATPLRDIMRKAGFDVVETNDPAVIRNVNRREDWARLRAS